MEGQSIMQIFQGGLLCVRGDYPHSFNAIFRLCFNKSHQAPEASQCNRLYFGGNFDWTLLLESGESGHY